jgi:uracil-DNA glycosylase
MGQKQDLIDAIKQELGNLKRSPLYVYRKRNHYVPVVGDGSVDAKILFIGEAPGRKEAETGRPFTGAAGKFLDTLLNSINLDRQAVYITNIVNDRPPDNRDPKPAEIKLYSPFLDRLIDIIRPEVIVTLGRFSMQYILEKYHSEASGQPIGDLHGKHVPVQTPSGKIDVLPLYHPAAALYNGSLRKVLEADFEVLRRYI